MKLTILTSSTYKLNSFSEVTAFFLMSLWSCNQLFLLLKYLIGKHLDKWLPQGKSLHHLPKKEGGHEWLTLLLHLFKTYQIIRY